MKVRKPKSDRTTISNGAYYRTFLSVRCGKGNAFVDSIWRAISPRVDTGAMAGSLFRFASGERNTRNNLCRAILRRTRK